MRKFRRSRLSEQVLLVAVESLGGTEKFWGPFDDVDDVIEWCKRTGAVVTVVPLSDPSDSVVGSL